MNTSQRHKRFHKFFTILAITISAIAMAMIIWFLIVYNNNEETNDAQIDQYITPIARAPSPTKTPARARPALPSSAPWKPCATASPARRSCPSVTWCVLKCWMRPATASSAPSSSALNRPARRES